MEDKLITIARDIRSKDLRHIKLSKALERIKNGASKDKVLSIRAETDKEKKSSIKQSLPCVLFSGEFEERNDAGLKTHSGLVILDFDHVDIDSTMAEVCANDFIYACWVSPSGDGVKALAMIADTEKHRQHYGALKELFPTIDEKNLNESRVCYESYDPNIYINENAKPFTKYIKKEKYQLGLKQESHFEIIKNILTWHSNRGDAFAQGNRDNFMFKFGSACCRFGIDKEDCISFACNEFLSSDSTFPYNELVRALNSSYRSNKDKFGTAFFEKNVLCDRTSRLEVEISQEMDESEKLIDVIYAKDTRLDTDNLYDNGRESVRGVDSPEIDAMFKMMKGEVTLLSGYGNQGKSTFFKWYFLMKAILYGEKFCFFSPEDAPAEEFFLHTYEMLLGASLDKSNFKRPSKEAKNLAEDFIDNHFVFIYPEKVSPTPEYIKERFLKVIIKDKVDGIMIDPFNQLANDYGKSGGRSDKYLETFLSDFAKFTRDNHVYGCIVAHPRNPEKKDAEGKYPCPDVYNVADGAMWNNKMDDIIIYNRPDFYTNPSSRVCEVHSRKIRRQWKATRGTVTMEYDVITRRFIIDGVDYMKKALDKKGLYFGYPALTEYQKLLQKDSLLEQMPIPMNNDIFKTVEVPF